MYEFNIRTVKTFAEYININQDLNFTFLKVLNNLSTLSFRSFTIYKFSNNTYVLICFTNIVSMFNTNTINNTLQSISISRIAKNKLFHMSFYIKILQEIVYAIITSRTLFLNAQDCLRQITIWVLCIKGVIRKETFFYQFLYRERAYQFTKMISEWCSINATRSSRNTQLPRKWIKLP